jgi:hypothetical protein
VTDQIPLFAPVQSLMRAADADSPWLVPAPRDPQLPLSKGALNQALRRMTL